MLVKELNSQEPSKLDLFFYVIIGIEKEGIPIVVDTLET
jgi:hypothetical protein